jgi:hypothetical protein
MSETERRSGEDRRAESRGDRRKPGRPPLPPEQRGHTISRKVKLPSKLEAFVAEMAIKRNISKHAVIVIAVKRLYDITTAAICSGAEIQTNPD